MKYDGLPKEMMDLPFDSRGIPIPWFVSWYNNVPDFRVVDGQRLIKSWRENLCWVCGKALFAFKAWVIGPVSAIERCSREPPAHPDCARFSLRSCPFLSRPDMARSKRAHPVSTTGGGVLIEDNSGVAAAWITKGRSGELFNPGNGPLFQIAEARSVEWTFRGRPASRGEVQAGIVRAAEKLRNLNQENGEVALRSLEDRISLVVKWLPAQTDLAC